jgi:hypothetical protein
MSILSWLRDLAAPRTRRHHRAPRRLALEALEDRAVPAALAYSTYFGNKAQVNAVAVDAAGDAFVTGTIDGSMPLLNAMQPTCKGGGDAVVAKFDPSGALVYSTYLGGKGNDDGLGIAVDGAGNAYVTGTTGSTDFPTLNAFQASSHGVYSDDFLTKLSPGGDLLYSTYLGGSGDEIGTTHVVADDAGNVYLCGRTKSSDFPISANAAQSSLLSTVSPYVTKLNTNLAGADSLVYSTYLNGANNAGFAVDATGAAYVAGLTQITKLNAQGSAIIYNTTLPGVTILAVAADAAGDVYLTGGDATTGFPTTPNAYRTTESRVGAAFVTELDATGSGLIYSSYLDNGYAQAQGHGIGLDAAGHVFISGQAAAELAPLPTRNAFQVNDESAVSDAFVAEFDLTQSGDASLVYSSYLGGAGAEYGYGIAVDGAGEAFVVGQTESYDFPRVNAVQTTNPAGSSGFVAKVIPGTNAGATTTTLVSSAPSALAGNAVTFTATVVANDGSGTPTGWVNFFVDGSMYASVPTDTAGHATYVTSTLAVGTHSIQAFYSESAAFAQSVSASLSEVVQAKPASSVSLTSSSTSVSFGQPVTLTARVKAASGSGTPTGTVTFMDGSVVLGTATLDNGVATLIVTTLTRGKHQITAVYGGDTDFATSTSAALNENVH